MAKVRKITRLTRKQAAILARFRDEWRGWSTSTARSDRGKAEAAILALRRRIGVTETPIFVWCASPATASLANHCLKHLDIMGARAILKDNLWGGCKNILTFSLPKLSNSLWSSLWTSLETSLDDHCRASLGADLGDKLRNLLGVNTHLYKQLIRFGAHLGEEMLIILRRGAGPGPNLENSLGAGLENRLRNDLGTSLWRNLRDILGNRLWADVWEARNRWQSEGDDTDNLSDALWGQDSSDWIAFHLFCRDILGVTYCDQISSALDLCRDLAQSCGYWWCYRHYVIVSDRPTVCRLDDRHLLHCETGPALVFADGWAAHAWHGTDVPSEWIEKDRLTPQIALAERNVERRRAACEILGWERILRELDARVVQRDDDPMIGELLEVDLPGAEKERFLRVQCATDRVFALPVPPTITTALEANAWTYGLDPASYRPEVRT